jgi:chromosome segregation protein
VSKPDALLPLLSHILCAETLDEALKLQNNLKTGELIITRDGTLLGINWLKKKGKDSQNQRDGVLARQKEIDEIQATLKKLKQNIEEQEQSLAAGRDALKQREDKKTELQDQLNELHREESQAQSSIDATQNRISQTEANQQRIITEIAELELRHASEQEAHQQATKLRNEAMALMETLEKDKTILQNQQAPLQQRVSEEREHTQRQREQTQQIQLNVETYKANRLSAQQQLERFGERLKQLEQRKQNLIEQQSGEKIQNIQDLQAQLEAFLEKRKVVDEKLSGARDELQAIDNDIREMEIKRHQAESDVEKLRTLLESLKLEWQEVTVREQTLQEQLEETEFDIESLKQSLDKNATLKTHQQALEDVQRKIERLGAINLAAIEEFKTQSERKVYLDQQNDDLVEALETLESAIAKIDRDTRNLFKDTFEKVNVRIQEMFPQLFGGGKAYLEMTGDDLLTTGVSIMAQPPGKRISSIHLMSGGEKALTAVALVFAIFELNPAPFCMLDEVDAPLDEANVGRFCQLVRKMSERVQFIFITHSKTTMELADNLIGVTMREPGVSRLVSVDVNEAERMANE